MGGTGQARPQCKLLSEMIIQTEANDIDIRQRDGLREYVGNGVRNFASQVGSQVFGL
jgi:hypothetical protein